MQGEGEEVEENKKAKIPFILAFTQFEYNSFQLCSLI